MPSSTPISTSPTCHCHSRPLTYNKSLHPTAPSSSSTFSKVRQYCLSISHFSLSLSLSILSIYFSPLVLARNLLFPFHSIPPAWLHFFCEMLHLYFWTVALVSLVGLFACLFGCLNGCYLVCFRFVCFDALRVSFVAHVVSQPPSQTLLAKVEEWHLYDTTHENKPSLPSPLSMAA